MKQPTPAQIRAVMRALGARSSKAKTAAARQNAKKAGRPWTCDRCGERYSPQQEPPAARGTTRAGRWRICTSCWSKLGARFASGQPR